MACFSPDAPKPMNYGQQTGATLGAQVNLAPALYSAEAQFSPAYTDLTAQNIQRLLQGTAGGEVTPTYGVQTAAQRGYYDAAGNFLSTRLQPGMPQGAAFHRRGDQFSAQTGTQTSQASPGLLSLLQDAATNQRSSDIADVASLGPEARAAILASNPDSAALLSRLNAQALSGLDAGTGFTPEEARQVQQASRAAFAARGMGGTNAAIGDELLQQFNLGQQLLRQRQAFAGNVLGQNQAVVGDPFMQILGRSSGAVGQAGQLIPGNLFDPESPYAGNLYNANQQYSALFAEPSTLAKVGQVSGAVGQFIGGIGSALI